MKRYIKLLVLTTILLASVFLTATPQEKITLASTTSTLDSGFFDVIIPVFEKKFDCQVKVIAVGTGQAMRLARDGNADVLLVHDRPSEEKFVAEGFGVQRLDVMHNDFFIIGPKDDPAGIKGLNVLDAFKKMNRANALFTSRGDDSGTHKKEKRLWESAGVKPAGSTYLESGSGMEATLRIANEKKTYCLIDRATWLAHQKETDALTILVEGDEILFNLYSVIVVSAAKFSWVNEKLATAFADFLRGPEGQKIIKEFGVDTYGSPLFFPDVIK